VFLILAFLLGLGGLAHADSTTTRDALDRLQEVLEMRIEDGVLSQEDLSPALLVSARPRYVDSESWYATRAIEVLQVTLGEGSLRLCEACMAPRVHVQEGTLLYQAGPVGIDEVVRLDDQLRGQATPARVGIWLDEHRFGVSIRIVDLRTGAVVFAQNIDPNLIENERRERNYTMAQDLERRARGDSLTQVFVDAGLFPNQHISFDWSDQFGKNNRHMAGFTVSFIDPLIGLGGNYHFVTPILNMSVGAKFLVSVPRALIRSLGDIGDADIDLIDPLLTGALVVRLPFGRSNYGLYGSFSTNGRLALGISLLNISPLPVIP